MFLFMKIYGIIYQGLVMYMLWFDVILDIFNIYYRYGLR